MLIDLILAAILVIIITAIICMVVDGAYTESALIGIIILIIAIQKLDSIQLVNTSPLISLAISAFVISVLGIFSSMVIHSLSTR